LFNKRINNPSFPPRLYGFVRSYQSLRSRPQTPWSPVCRCHRCSAAMRCVNMDGSVANFFVNRSCVIRQSDNHTCGGRTALLMKYASGVIWWHSGALKPDDVNETNRYFCSQCFYVLSCPPSASYPKSITRTIQLP